MRIEPVGPPPPRPPAPAPQARVPVAPARCQSAERHGEGVAETGERSRRITSQMVQWSPGVTVLRVLDTRTGEVLMQTPPEQVLHLVEGVVREMRERVLGHGGND